MPQQYSFAKSHDEAEQRADKFKDKDPFPSIPRALLSSAEIHDYVQVTGMLYPFHDESLNAASYEAHLGERFIMWDGAGNYKDRTMEKGKPCTLPANSITFLQVEPKFRLPNYIALRFNLRITHVHRGLLLGTGPLIDPGFRGELLIPVHNLTSSDYDIDTEKALIWIESTKTTFCIKPREEEPTKPRQFLEFPKDKRYLRPAVYLFKANRKEAIRSSIPLAIYKSSEDARAAQECATVANESAKKAESTIRFIGISATVAIVVALAAILFQVWTVIQNTYSLTTPIVQQSAARDERVKSFETQLNRLRDDLRAANDDVAQVN